MKKQRFKDKLWKDLKLGLITPEEYLKKEAKHEEQLEKKRKYKKGECVKSLDELIEQEFVYIFDQITHRKWFANYQIGFIKLLIIRGYVCKAIKKENENENLQ